MSDAELFWVVSNGIRMTGMPAFSPTHSPEEIWTVVAFVRHLGSLSEAEKASLRTGSEGDAGHHHAGDEAAPTSQHDDEKHPPR